MSDFLHSLLKPLDHYEGKHSPGQWKNKLSLLETLWLSHMVIYDIR